MYASPRHLIGILADRSGNPHRTSPGDNDRQRGACGDDRRIRLHRRIALLGLYLVRGKDAFYAKVFHSINTPFYYHIRNTGCLNPRLYAPA
jgi:hypothetical protein